MSWHAFIFSMSQSNTLNLLVAHSIQNDIDIKMKLARTGILVILTTYMLCLLFGGVIPKRETGRGGVGAHFGPVGPTKSAVEANGADRTPCLVAPKHGQYCGYICAGKNPRGRCTSTIYGGDTADSYFRQSLTMTRATNETREDDDGNADSNHLHQRPTKTTNDANEHVDDSVNSSHHRRLTNGTEENQDDGTGKDDSVSTDPTVQNGRSATNEESDKSFELHFSKGTFALALLSFFTLLLCTWFQYRATEAARGQRVAAEEANALARAAFSEWQLRSLQAPVNVEEPSIFICCDTCFSSPCKVLSRFFGLAAVEADTPPQDLDDHPQDEGSTQHAALTIRRAAQNEEPIEHETGQDGELHGNNHGQSGRSSDIRVYTSETAQGNGTTNRAE